MNKIVVICNIAHIITPGVCAFCERDKVQEQLALEKQVREDASALGDERIRKLEAQNRLLYEENIRANDAVSCSNAELSNLIAALLEFRKEELEESSIIRAAVELCAFTRTHVFPREGTDNFFRLIDLIDKLDTSLRAENLMAQDIQRLEEKV